MLGLKLIHVSKWGLQMSHGWLSWSWYLIWMGYDNVIMSSGWHTLPFLSHPDEIANFDFSQHAVALQRFRIESATRQQVKSVSAHFLRTARRLQLPNIALTWKFVTETLYLALKGELCGVSILGIYRNLIVLQWDRAIYERIRMVEI